MYECVQLVRLPSHEVVGGLGNLKVDIFPAGKLIVRGVEGRELVVSRHQHVRLSVIAASYAFSDHH